MSTPPPPPPSSYNQAPPDPAAYDRRTLKAQRQAAAAQARWQQAQWRQQRQAAQRNSALGPVLLIAIGVVLLLLQTGRLGWPSVIAWFSHWWPAILIGAGLLRLAEWFLDRFRPATSTGALPPRSSVSGGAVMLLILLAIAGALATLDQRGSNWAQRTFGDKLDLQSLGDWAQIFGARSESTETSDAELAPDGTLTVDDPNGDITAIGSSSDGRVHLTVTQHIFAWQQADLSSRRLQERPSFRGDSDHLVLSTTLRDRDTADFTLQLPHTASLVVHSGHGDVRIEELRGSTSVDALNGDVSLTALTGPVHLSTQDDDADIAAHSLTGGLTLDGRSGDITLTDLDGPLTLHGDFFGTTHLERIHGAVHFQSSFTDLACVGIPGSLDIDGRTDLSATRIEGPLTLATTDRELSIDGLRGGGSVTDRNGSVKLSLASPVRPLTIANQNGSIELSLPTGAAIDLEASTQNGDIHNDLGLTAKKNGETANLNSAIGGGGPKVDLRTTEGDVTLHHGPTQTSTGWDQPAQRITPAPRIRN